MLHIFSQLRQRLRWETRRTVTVGVGALLIITGVGFAAAAAWSALAPIVGATGASLILAAIFTGLGLVVISLCCAQDKPPIDSPLAQTKTRPVPKGINAGSSQEMPPLMEAFLFGMTVYLQNQKRKP